METTDVNAQTQETPAPVVTGPTVNELQAQLDETKKQSEGRLRDLQQERAKRQELEARVTSPAPSPVQPDVREDELGQVLKPYISPLQNELEQLRYEKTQKYLEQKTGKSWDQIEADRDFQDKLTQVIRKYGLTGNVYDMTVRAYDLLQLVNLKTEQEDKARAALAAQHVTLPTGTAPVTSAVTAKKYTADEFNGMNPREFGNLSKSGDFRKLPDGTFEYKPR